MPGSTFRDYIEDVRRSVDIAEVIGETVELRRAGKSLVGLCPFHQEKTPSFHVEQDRGVYYCFGCQAGGDVFKFLTELHGMTFVEAVQMLGDRKGIPRPRRQGPESQAEDRRRRRVLEALAAAQELYASRLLASEGAGARRYLAGRGLGEDEIRNFGLGFAPESWDFLLRELTSRGFDDETLRSSGLVAQRRGGSGVYDRFRGRVTFPIRDTAARIVSFGGRALGDGEPKYLNGPETAVYDKGRVLFRFSEVAREIRETGQVVLVEGYFDAVGLAARGVPAVVAVCGTALGPGHAALLRQRAREIVLFLDGDRAGRRAARRAMQPLLEAGLGVRVATPPPGQDPDDLAREGGREAVAECLSRALELPEFLVAEARREFDTESLQGRVSALEMILGYLALLPSPLARAEAGDRVAAGLKIEDGVVREELKRAARRRRPSVLVTASQRSAETRMTPSEAVLLRYLGSEASAGDGEAAARLATEAMDAGLGAPCRKAVERWLTAFEGGEHWDLREMAAAVAQEEAGGLLALACATSDEPRIGDARGAVTTIRTKALRARLRALQQEIDNARDPSDQDRLTREKLILAREIQGLGSAPEAR